ncbi:MAG TPA: helix-turn-helix domain-containing protein [Chloroflexota bacterium]|nr:helix-turn-helix domain-containing protein [Chloroflexota bacterium]
MAAITVGELREALPLGSELLGGASGLGRAAGGTATFRARTPAFPALHGGELAIVPLTLLRQVDPQTHTHLDRLVTQLAGAGIAGLVLLDGASDVSGAAAATREAAARAADAQGVPLFMVPPGVTAEQIDLALHRHLAGQRAALLQRSQQLQQEFTQIALSGRGVQRIVSHLAGVAGTPAAWEALSAIEPLAWALPDPAWVPSRDLTRAGADLPTVLRAARLPLQRWSATANGALESGEVAVLPLRADEAQRGSGSRAGENSWRRLVIAVPGAAESSGTLDGVAGFLSLISREEQGAATEARLALSAASLAVSIELMRARTASEAQGSAVAGLLHDWLAGRLAEDAIQARAGQIGLALEPPFAVVALESHPVADAAAARAVATALGAVPQNEPLVAAVGDGQSALIVSLPAGATLDTATVRLHAALAQRANEGMGSGGPVYAGIGRIAAAAADVTRAFDEARRALAVARRLGGMHRVAYFGTLGAYRVLAATDPAELAGFRAETLGALLRAGERGSVDLLRTLEAYLACGGSPQETAQRLHTHRNTVLYRLQRIGELLGTDVRAPEVQFTLWLALRAAEVLGDPQVTPAATTRRTRPAA